MDTDVQKHYDTFLAEIYAGISGGPDEQVRKNKNFFAIRGITPGKNYAAIDLGSGSGFQSVPLAQLGYSVTAVDFCQRLLDGLHENAGAYPIDLIRGDIRNYSLWSGRHPSLIVCMGDTLTHLSSLTEAEDLIRQCSSELDPGGRLVVTLRDYSREPKGEVLVVPVVRKEGRIFLCRLEYHMNTLTVQDILYSRKRGIWQRSVGSYEKIRIAPGSLTRMLTGAGFTIGYSSVDNGMISVIALKDR
jgi:SAM-dependent methyltransferase